MMAKGHHRVALIMGLGTVPYCAYQMGFQPALGFAFGQMLATLLFSPDLDLKVSKSRQSWGILSIIWTGYHRLFRHRGISHWPVLGTLSRWIYLHILVLATLFCVSVMGKSLQGELPLKAAIAAWDQVDGWQRSLLMNLETISPFWIWTGLGCLCADLWHLLADLTWSLARRKKSKSRRPRPRRAS